MASRDEDIYAITFASVANSEAHHKLVFVVVHANGNLAVVHPDTGHAIATYSDIQAVSLCGSSDAISDPSLIFVGRAKKRGVSCYRITASSAGKVTDGSEGVVPEHPGVSLVEMCTVPAAGEAVTAVAAASATKLSSFLVVAVDTSNCLRLWQLRKTRGEQQEPQGDMGPGMLSPSQATPPSVVRGTMVGEVFEESSVLCMVVVRNRYVWCGYEDGSVAVYDILGNHPDVGSSPSRSDGLLLSSPHPSFRQLTRSPLQSVELFSHPALGSPTAPSLPAAGWLQLLARSNAETSRRSPVTSLCPAHHGGSAPQPAGVVAGCANGSLVVFSAVTSRVGPAVEPLSVAAVYPASHHSTVAAMCSVPWLAQLWSISSDKELKIWKVEGSGVSAKVSPPRQSLSLSSSSTSDESNNMINARNAAQTVVCLTQVVCASLDNEVDGPVHCLCHAQPLQTVAGGGSGSDLLMWYPSDMLSLVGTEEDAAPLVVRGDNSSLSPLANTSGGLEGCASLASDGDIPRASIPQPTTFEPRSAESDASPGIAIDRPMPTVSMDDVVLSSRDESQSSQQWYAVGSASVPRDSPERGVQEWSAAEALPTSSLAEDRLKIQQLQAELRQLLDANGRQRIDLDIAASRHEKTVCDLTTISERNLARARADAQSELALAVAAEHDKWVLTLHTLEREAQQARQALHLEVAIREQMSLRVTALEREVDELQLSAQQVAAQRDDAITVTRQLTEELAKTRALAEAARSREESTIAANRQLTEELANTRSLAENAPRKSDESESEAIRGDIAPAPESHHVDARGHSTPASGLKLLETLTAELKLLRKKTARAPTVEVATQTAGGDAVGATRAVLALERQVHFLDGLLEGNLRRASPTAAELDRMTHNPPEDHNNRLVTSCYFVMRDVLGAERSATILRDALSSPDATECDVLEVIVATLCRRIAMASDRSADVLVLSNTNRGEVSPSFRGYKESDSATAVSTLLSKNRDQRWAAVAAAASRLQAATAQVASMNGGTPQSFVHVPHPLLADYGASRGDPSYRRRW